MDKGIIVGVEHETSFRRSLDFAIFRLATNVRACLHTLEAIEADMTFSDPPIHTTRPSIPSFPVTDKRSRCLRISLSTSCLFCPFTRNFAACRAGR